MSDRRQQGALAGVGGLLVVLLIWLAVLLRPSQGVPCVDYIPAGVGCTPDSPAVLNAR